MKVVGITECRSHLKEHLAAVAMASRWMMENDGG